MGCRHRLLLRFGLNLVSCLRKRSGVMDKYRLAEPRPPEPVTTKMTVERDLLRESLALFAVLFERIPGYPVSMPHEHHYTVSTVWTGNKGTGTSNYKAYARDHEISADRKSAPILGSSDPAFRGDPSRYNPEQLLVASLSTCHMLWFLHLCSDAAIVVTDYRDEAAGTMAEASDGGGQFMEVILKPRAAISDPARIAEATALHARAHELCFIARSVNFPVKLQPVVVASIASGSSRAGVYIE